MKNKSSRKTTKKKKIAKLEILIVILQAIASLLAAYVIIKIGVLPTEYLIPLLLLGLLLYLGIAYWVLNKKNALSKTISLLLSIAILVVSSYVIRSDAFINIITGANTDTHVVSIIVMQDSEYQTLEDLTDGTIGANTIQDEEKLNQAVELFSTEKSFALTLASYNPYEALAQALYSGEIQAIALSESHRVLVEAYYENFSSETRVIDAVSFEEEVDQVADNNVDVSNDVFSFYISGIDTTGPVSTVSNSDVNMIMTVNPNTNQILLTSVPRDFYVELATKGAMDKLTHAGIYGVQESLQTLENLFSIDIDYYIRVNFASVVSIVDALGGVDVYSYYNFTSMHGGYSFSTGYNNVNGAQALGFVRERYSLPGGDRDRIKHQQTLLAAILNKAMSPSIITNYTSFLNAISSSFEMSMGSDQFTQLIRNQVSSMASWEILQYQVDGTGSTSTQTYSLPGWNLYVMLPDYTTVETAAQLIQAMENGETISIPE